LDASEFNSEDINTYNFTFFNIPFPEEQDGEFFIIDFSNPDPEKSVKFYMRQARLINITPRPILDNQRLYGNDWSYDIINSTFINNVMHKHMRPYGCISIDIHPYIGPWSSIRFEMKAPPDLIIRVNVELETIQDLMTYVNPSVDSIHWNEDTWTTVEVKLKDFIYNKLYDRLDICNQKSYNSWIKVRNIKDASFIAAADSSDYKYGLYASNSNIEDCKDGTCDDKFYKLEYDSLMNFNEAHHYQIAFLIKPKGSNPTGEFWVDDVSFEPLYTNILNNDLTIH